MSDTVVRAVLQAGDGGPDHVELRRRASEALRRHVGYDLAVWATIDPTTLMWTHCLLDGMPRDPALEHAVFLNEYGQQDVLKLTHLAAARRPVGTLHDATSGRPGASRRYAELYAPRGFTDELRLLFVDEGSVWGALVLCRSGAPFTADEASAVEPLSRPLGTALRRSLLREAATHPDRLAVAPGLVLVTVDGAIADVSPEAADLLATVDAAEVPAAVAGVVARRTAGVPARTCLPGRDGQWLALHATALGDRVAVVVEQVRPYELAELIVRTRGLTPREREVVTQVARGRTTTQMARALAISEWTVQDHLKSVFAKFEVSSRAELVAALFFDHYAPRHEAEDTPSPYGWYLDPAATSATASSSTRPSA